MSAGNKGKRRKDGKKGKTTLALSEFLSDKETPAPGFQARHLNWADAMDNEEENDKYPSMSNSQSLDMKKVVLPTAPKAARGLDVDTSQVPNTPPFTAYVGNLPYEVNEEDICKFFEKIKVTSVRIPRENGDRGRMRGFGYAEFPDRNSLIEALALNNESLKNRMIKVSLATDHAENERGGGVGGRGSDDRVDRTAGDWRSGAKEEASAYRNERYDGQSSERGSSDFDSYRSNRSGFDRDNSRYDRNDSDRGGFERRQGFSDRERDGGGFDSYDRNRDRGGGGFDRGGGGGGGSGRRDFGSGFQDGGSERSERRGFDNWDRRGNDDNKDRRDDREDFRRGGGGGGNDDFRRRDDNYGRRGGDDYRRGGGGNDYGRRTTGDSYGRDSYDNRMERMTERETPMERPKLQLAPRSIPVEKTAAAAAPPQTSSSIFGGAKPVDTAAREREIEERLAKERESKKIILERKDEPVRRISTSSGPRSRRSSESGPKSSCSEDDAPNKTSTTRQPRQRNNSNGSNHSDTENNKNRDYSGNREETRNQSNERGKYRANGDVNHREKELPKKEEVQDPAPYKNKFLYLAAEGDDVDGNVSD